MPDANKIAFILCTNDEERCRECTDYIRRLRVPEGMTAEILPIRDASGLCSGYNAAMRATDAMYKVYLHHDVLILHRGFIPDALACFRAHPKAGMLGMVGRKDFANREQLYYNESFGTLYETSIDRTIRYKHYSAREDERVLHLDGLLMMTRVDLPWREELFDGWHLYDVSQSLEMQRAGYEVFVPYMEQPWVLHDCGLLFPEGYAKQRDRAIKEYREFFMKIHSDQEE